MEPHPGQVPLVVEDMLGRDYGLLGWPRGALVISARCCLAASWALHLDMVASRILLSKSSTVSPSKRPSTIWSLGAFIRTEFTCLGQLA